MDVALAMGFSKTMTKVKSDLILNKHYDGLMKTGKNRKAVAQ